MRLKKIIIITVIINIFLLSGCGKNNNKVTESGGDSYIISSEDIDDNKIQITDISGVKDGLESLFGKDNATVDIKANETSQAATVDTKVNETIRTSATENITTSDKNHEQTSKNIVKATSAETSTVQETSKDTTQAQKIVLGNHTYNENIGATCSIINTNGCTADTAASKIVSTLISSRMSQEVIVRVLHDYLIRHTFYDEEAMNKTDTYGAVIHTETGALVNRLAVCDGYAKAYKLLCNKAGIECEVVYGKAITDVNSDIGHAWNIVKIDGIWYQIDVTFDDPIMSDMSSGECEAGKNLTYDYYLLTDDIIYLDHTPDNRESIPKCTSTKYVRCDNMVNSEKEIEEILVNIILSNGKQSVYTVDLHCKKANEELIAGTYLGNAMQNAINRCVQEMNCSQVSVNMLIQKSGNGMYGSITVTINAEWS